MSQPRVDGSALVGAPVPRLEDPRLLQGRACFLDDLAEPGQVELAFLRSPHGHALVREIRRRPAPPAVQLFDAGDLRLPELSVPVANPGHRPVTRPLIARERARFVGEIVGVVVAPDRYQAEDGLELFEVEYEPLPALCSIAAALAEDAVQLHAMAPGNILFEATHTAGDLEAAFARADLVLEREFEHPRLAASPIETRGILARPTGTGLEVWSSTQVPHLLQQVLAASLELQLEQVRVRTPDIGGGFGVKAHVYPEEIIAAALALRLGRAVKWVEDRREHLLSATHAREQRVWARAAFSRDGRWLGLEARIDCDQGAYPVYPFGAMLEPLGTAGLLPGPYRLGAYRYRARAISTNKSPEGAYRGVGLPVAAFVHERLMDLAARALGLDAAEIRRRNFIRPEEFPYRSVAGAVYDSGSYAAVLDAALRAFDAAAPRRPARADDGWLRGVGLACYTESTSPGSQVYRWRGMSAVPGHDAARLRLGEDGRFHLQTSLPSIGQGLATTFAQTVAEQLGVPLTAVTVEQTDTAQAPPGTGTFASRSAVSGTGAIIRAAADLRHKLGRFAAGLLEVSPDDLQWHPDGLGVRGVAAPSQRWDELARAARAAGVELVGLGQCDPPSTFPFAVHAVEVRIDPETGLAAIERYVIAEDCGPLINPLVVDGQVHGATAQGIGGALFEQLVYDEQGQLLSGSFLDYLLPAATDLPTLTIEHHATPSPVAPGGFKGVGEGGTLAPPGALANAISDALACFGIEINALPATPERLRQLIRARAAAGTPGQT